LATAITRQSQLRIERSLDRQLPQLPPDQELLVYRVAQESLTNVVRHAHAETAWLELRRVPGAVELADDHAIVRRGVATVLEGVPDLELVAEAQDGLEAVEIAQRIPLDLAILDFSMPRMTGLQATAELARRRPEVRVLILSMHDNEEYFFEALRAGASGYVLKSTADRDLVDACRATMPFVYPTVAAAMVAEKLQRLGRGEEVSRDVLTERETQVVKLIAEAYTNEQIAQALVISPKTVERHRANILEKLEMRDRVELTRYAIRRGLVAP
jgi:DNA-binding NarL/FixJ family response regulator